MISPIIPIQDTNHCILNITRNASCPSNGQCLARLGVLDVALVIDANTHRISIPWFNGKKVVPWNGEAHLHH